MNFFDWLVDFALMVWQLVLNSLNGMFAVVDVLIKSVISVSNLKMFVPSILFASIGIVTGIGAIKLILGWGNK